MSDDALSEEFFAEVGDKYYPQVLEGLERLGAGEVGPAIEMLSRPLHTIKGVTGFMPGFEVASRFTHTVESFLKKLQAGKLPHTEDNIALATTGVNAVFTVIEQIRDRGAPDQGDIDAVCRQLAAAGGEADGPAAAAADAACLALEETPEAAVLRITVPRVHKRAQSEQITGAILKIPQEQPVLLDLSGVKSFGSGVWEDILGLADMWSIRVRGLRGACRENFYAWNLDARFAVVPEVEEEGAEENGSAGRPQ